jgi:NAD(P)-dependent dehydrogenase (short-subunit alcohol dehydrogenase family)
MAAMHLNCSGYDRRRLESPLERVADPSEVAAAILYLASPEAEFATGTVLDFNGASQLRM